MPEEIKIERKRHKSSLDCKDKKCNGEPKKKIEATTFCGSICEKCFAIYDYVVFDNSMEKAFKEKKKEEIKKKPKNKKPEKGEQLNFDL